MVSMAPLRARYSVGDDVWIPQRVEGRMRPYKTRIFAVQITDYGNRRAVKYFGGDGVEITAPITGTIEDCEKVLNILEYHRNEMTAQLEKIVPPEDTAEKKSPIILAK